MKTQGWGNALLAVLLLASAAVEATPPTLFSEPDFQSPVRGDPGDLLMIAGDGFSTADTVVYQAIGNTTAALTTPSSIPATNSAAAGVASVVSTLNVPYSLTISLPSLMTADQSYALWVVNSVGEWSSGIKINDARPIWFTPDFSYATAPLANLPRQLKVVGRNLAPAPGATTQVRLTGPSAYILNAANDGDPSTAIERYAAIVTLPGSMPIGSYTVEVSRDGTSWVPVSDGRSFTVQADPSALPELNISDPAFGSCVPNDGIDDTVCIWKAITAAKNAGGGDVIVPAGVWDMSNDAASGVTLYGLLLPIGVNLIGHGTDDTNAVIERGTSWNLQKPIFTPQGHNLITGLYFKDLHVYQRTDDGRTLIELGVQPNNAQAYNPTDPSYVSNVIITKNVFDKPFVALQDGEMPEDHIFITYNLFGAYKTGLTIDNDPQLTDSVFDYNRYLPGSYIDTSIAQGAIPTGVSSAYRVDFSNNVADGTSTQFLYDPVNDAKGFRAAYFWTLRGDQEGELISQNTVTCSGDKDGDGEAFAFDDNHNLGALPSKQPAQAATANTVTVAGPFTNQANGSAYPAGTFNNFWVTIASGPGEGQSRRVDSYTGTGPITFTVSPAWDVPPQSSSQITVAKSLWQVYLVDNFIDQRVASGCTKKNLTKPAGGLIQMDGQATDIAIEGNQQFDSSGIQISLGYIVTDPPYTYPDTKFQNFVEVRGNRVDGEYDYGSNCSWSGIEVEYSAIGTAGYPPPIEGYGISIGHNTLNNADGYHDGAIVLSRPWLGGPAPDQNAWETVENTLVFSNSISNITLPVPTTDPNYPSCGTSGATRRLGLMVDDGMAWHTVLANNSCTNVANGTAPGVRLLDYGTRSKRVCSSAPSNSCECAVYQQGTDATASSSMSYPGAQVQSDLNIVVVVWAGAPAAVTVADTAGNSYQRMGSVIQVPASVTGGAVQYQAVFFSKNIVAASSNTVIATFDMSVSSPLLKLMEYRGVDFNTPVNAVVSTYGTGSAADAGWLTATSGNQLLLEVVSTPATGGILTQTRFVPAPGPYHETASVAPSSYWMAHLFSLNLEGLGSQNQQGLTTPGGLSATAAAGGAVSLSWTASTDHLGVDGYFIERCAGVGCQSFTQVGSVNGGTTTYSDSGLTPSTTYTYRVRATDVGDLLSGYSGTAAVTAIP